jgi:predicted metal-binding protein
MTYAYGGLGMQRKGVIGEEQFEEDLKRFAKLAVKMGAVTAKPIDVKNIFVADWVRLKCQYGCGGYGNL